MKSTLFRIGSWSVALLVLMSGEPSRSQSYPGKPVRLVVGATAASAPDVIIRPIAQRFSDSVRQPVVVDNRGGAGGVIAAQLIASAPPDGYTILLVGAGAMSIAPFLAKKRPFDPVRDFTPVTLIAAGPLIVSSHPLFSAKSVKEVIALAKSGPKQVLIGGPSAGSVQHLTIEMFNRAAGISLGYVPYKGGAAAVINTVGGQTPLVITAIPAVLPQIKASRLRPLAVTSARRSIAFPDVPAIAEAGLPGFESVTWYAIFAPRNTPAGVVEKLYGELRKAAGGPDSTLTAHQEGVELEVKGPKALAELQRLEIAKWQRIIRESNIVLE
jgi:tripartite-type tricarboxylate transporter receptor subunit TctC